MAYFRRFILMLQFFTTIPVRADVKAEPQDFGRGLAMAPAAGLVIGLLLAGFHYLAGQVFPLSVVAVLTIAVYVFLTGGLHLDGLGDSADGLFSNRPKERILEIMKDSRVGTNAVLAVVLVLFLDITMIAALESQRMVVLLLMPIAGRIGSLIGAGTSGYAGLSEGPGKWCVQYCRKKDIIIGLILYFALCFAIAREFGLVLSILPPISAFILAKILGKKIGGVTGDILGAICELNQVIFLMAALLFSRL